MIHILTRLSMAHADPNTLPLHKQPHFSSAKVPVAFFPVVSPPDQTVVYEVEVGRKRSQDPTRTGFNSKVFPLEI